MDIKLFSNNGNNHDDDISQFYYRFKINFYRFVTEKLANIAQDIKKWWTSKMKIEIVKMTRKRFQISIKQSTHSDMMMMITMGKDLNIKTWKWVSQYMYSMMTDQQFFSEKYITHIKMHEMSDISVAWWWLWWEWNKEWNGEGKKCLNPLVSVKCYLPTCHATSHIHTFIVVIISCGI